jgi:hypothetical protein
VVRGLDAYLSRGHERQDDTDCPHCGEPECQCPHEPFYCDHRIEVGTFCAACAVAGEVKLTEMFVRMLKKIEGGEP